MCTEQRDSQSKVRRGRSRRGFTLIELLITVAIILIIAAIAIPSYLRARIAANESAAVANLRAIVTASTAYSVQWSNGYAPSLDALGGTGVSASCDQAILLDALLTAPPYQKSGYTFGYQEESGLVPPVPTCGAQGSYGYFVTATPSVPGVTGQRSFCSDTPGVIHFDLTGQTAASPAACDALSIL
ncbi:MAG TPA: prepilin-type N-terminal cleavage/methylation domain-containing protein [Candidatus Cybelea sp.]|nr:prepilin-type N-terminal cleavage/methylation domain-containing protein [Candidatus Cybelea sp.]